jgi:hypothetical protein
LRAGLPALSGERLEFHVHAHLDVLVNGVRAPVPANIGIDSLTRVISPLHTHDDTGIIHLEAERPLELNLGQFFTEWAVRLDGDCVGGYCRPDTPWTVYVNGDQWPGAAADAVIHAHDEIAMVIGRPPAEIPSRYDFPQGY